MELPTLVGAINLINDDAKAIDDEYVIHYSSDGLTTRELQDLEELISPWTLSQEQRALLTTLTVLPFAGPIWLAARSDRVGGGVQDPRSTSHANWTGFGTPTTATPTTQW